MPLDDKYLEYQNIILDTVEALNECSTVVNSLQKSTYNPEMMALTFSIQILIELVAETAALSLNNNINLREHSHSINDIIDYLQ